MYTNNGSSEDATTYADGSSYSFAVSKSGISTITEVDSSGTTATQTYKPWEAFGTQVVEPSSTTAEITPNPDGRDNAEPRLNVNELL